MEQEKKQKVVYEWRKGGRGRMLDAHGSALGALVMVGNEGRELLDLYRSGSLTGQALKDARASFGTLEELEKSADGGGK